MVSKILLRLIDEAVFPAIVLIVSKILAIFLCIQWFQLDWKINTLSTFPNIVFNDLATTLTVSTYSTFFMYLVAILGLVWVLVRAYHLHDTHISPRLVLDLLSWNMGWLITSSHDVYHKGLVWLSYIWLITLLTYFQMVLGVSVLWLIIVTTLMSSLVTWLFVADIEKEIVLT